MKMWEEEGQWDTPHQRFTFGVCSTFYIWTEKLLTRERIISSAYSIIAENIQDDDVYSNGVLARLKMRVREEQNARLLEYIRDRAIVTIEFVQEKYGTNAHRLVFAELV